MNELTKWEQWAVDAYHRAGRMPTPTRVDTLEHEGVTYVRLAVKEGILWMYKVLNKHNYNVLTTTVNWPRELDIKD